ncbi:acylphosphatase [Tolumonas auensis DSM 9187]|uniref:acylphosphatase n=1 Tax=Tolumonas auensis (strain DSM 9187 / NBRC 110442 / TA 4) TaxID=595494 RepID=C4L7W1_TOLAT|nr:acylphosphatase [Tolumonas auensis]ACQ91760.1 acylphosphatase [Tolumonas auensis DSM 9187]NCB56836.1 acylphosphatase [Gammaproteobacteria bacterium]
MTPPRSVRIQVYGIVQGVGFRYFTQQEASRLGLCGRATNLSDGSVEVLAQGDAQAVEKLIHWLKTGPRTASVDYIEITELAAGAVNASSFRAY